MTHDLKTWPIFFQAAIEGKKPWEIRHDEGRNFNLGDFVTRREFEPTRGVFTDRTVTGRILYLVKGKAAEEVGCKPGYCLMTLEPVSNADRSPAEIGVASVPVRLGTAIEAVCEEISPVSQIIKDSRGERHVVTGEGMDELAVPGMMGTLYVDGEKKTFHVEQ